MGWAAAGLGRAAQWEAWDRLGVRRHLARGVFVGTRTGLGAAAAVSRAFPAVGRHGAAGSRPAHGDDPGVFDLTPTPDEQMLAEAAAQIAGEVLRPMAAAGDDTGEPPAEVLRAAGELGLTGLGVPEELGGILAQRGTVAATLVAEALAHGDLGLAVAVLAPGAVASALALWGDEQQQQTYLPALLGDQPPVAALALAEPRPLFDAGQPSCRARRRPGGYTLDGTKSLVVRGSEAELLLIGADLDGTPALFLLESGTPGLSLAADPSMGLRAAALSRVELTEVQVPDAALVGGADGRAYAECVRLSRLAWCALAVGTAQAVLDYVTPYVIERRAFGEPIGHRQSVAFAVADMAIELRAMRLLTYRAASRAARGDTAAREIALARVSCADRGMRIGSDGVQLLGGHGYVKEHPVERWYRDLRAVGIAEGGVLV